MISYIIDFDASGVEKMLSRLQRDMPEINRRILGVLSEETISRSQKQYLRGGHPLHRRTGKLSQSLAYKVGTDYADVGTNIVYGAIHEFGGTIKPGAKGFLAWQSGGKWVFTRKPVRIPKRPYLRPALDDTFKSGRAAVVIERVLTQELAKRFPGEVAS